MSATPLVLPSSLGTTEALWDRNVRYWSETFELVSYTQPGSRSVAELGTHLLDVADAHGLERFSVCGLSLGGATAMWVAASAPERIDRLVLACTSARFGDPEPWLERAATVREHGLEPIADSIVSRWFTGAPPSDLATRFRRMLVATTGEDYARCCEALAAWDFRQHLGEITAPTLVISAAHDPATPLEHAELLAQRIPNARLALLDDAAHLANAEQPEAFSRLVTEHVAPVEVA